MAAALFLSSIALAIGAVAIVQASVMLRREMRVLGGKIDLLQSEVSTGNTKTIGGLLALQEGRRIQAGVEPADRTAHEQGYVDHLKEDEG